MKNLVSFLICLLACAQPLLALQTNDQPSATVRSINNDVEEAKLPNPVVSQMLPDGTPVKLRLSEDISSERMKSGQSVSFEVIEEVDVQGIPVILKGTSVLATVIDAEPSRSFARGGRLDVRVNSAHLTDGEEVQLRAVRRSEVHGRGRIKDATRLVFLPGSPILPFMQGMSVEIPSGTLLTAFIQGDVRLDITKMLLPRPAPVVLAITNPTRTSGSVVKVSAESGSRR